MPKNETLDVDELFETLSSSKVARSGSSQSESSEEEMEVSEEEYSLGSPTEQMRVSLPKFARAVVRYNASDTAAADIGSSLLVDLGWVTTDDNSMVIDRSKVGRERAKLLVAAREMQEDDEITGIFFDGRKDFSTLCRKQDQETGKYFGSTIREEHVSVLSEPI